MIADMGFFWAYTSAIAVIFYSRRLFSSQKIKAQSGTINVLYHTDAMNQTSNNHFEHEIDQFNSQAAFWWDLSGPFKTLHQINPVRLKYITDRVSLDGQQVLDVGCGGGILSEALAQAGAEVTGLDLSKASLQTAKLHLNESGLKVNYQQQSMEDFAAANPESQDVICCLEMLEHVPNPESIIDACLTALKPGGWLFLSTLNRTPKAMMLGIFAAEHILKIVPKGTHHFEQFIKPSELVKVLNNKTVNIQDLTGMRYNPITQSASLDAEDLDINYFVACQKHNN